MKPKMRKIKDTEYYYIRVLPNAQNCLDDITYELYEYNECIAEFDSYSAMMTWIKGE